MCVCVCVSFLRAYVHACVHACVRVCVCYVRARVCIWWGAVVLFCVRVCGYACDYSSSAPQFVLQCLVLLPRIAEGLESHILQCGGCNNETDASATESTATSTAATGTAASSAPSSAPSSNAVSAASSASDAHTTTTTTSSSSSGGGGGSVQSRSCLVSAASAFSHRFVAPLRKAEADLRLFAVG